MFGRVLTRGLPVVVFGILFLLPSEAHARRRGFFLITTGQTVKHIGDVPAENQPLVQMATSTSDAAVGYLHSRFGVFFLDLWTWGGEYCLYKDDDVWTMTQDQAAALLGKSPDDVSTPFFYKVPPLLMLLVFGAVVFVGVKLAQRFRSGEPRASEE